MDLNARIKARREALNMSQTALAERVRELSGSKSFTQQSVGKFEKPGARSSYLHYILQALDEAEKNLTGQQPESATNKPAVKPIRSSTASSDISPVEHELVNIFRDLSKTQKENVLSYIRGMRDASLPTAANQATEARNLKKRIRKT